MSAKFFNGEYYHIYNRGVEKRDIFLDEADYYRFILGVTGFNAVDPILNLRRIKDNESGEAKINQEPVVDIVCYSLMPNHYHFLLRQISNGGVSKFMQKLGIGYTKYFNKRYDRTGVLFQGIFKARHISNNEYLLHLSRYIHLNALSLMRPNWHKDGIEDKQGVEKFLKEYKWHSLPFWLKHKSCLIKLYPEIVLGQFNSADDYMKFMVGWSGEDYSKIKDLLFDS